MKFNFLLIKKGHKIKYKEKMFSNMVKCGSKFEKAKKVQEK
jgi:hypothetical protein